MEAAPKPRAGSEVPDLLERARAGDSSAFEAIYHRFAGTVHGIALASVGPDEADDVTQEAFVSIHRALGTVTDAAGLPAWICTVARNAAIDALRRRGRRPRPEPIFEVAAPERGDDGDLARRVLELVRGLPEAYRETMVLRLVEGLTGPEIAERTGLTHGSVRVNLSRGMALLRPLLEKEGWR